MNQWNTRAREISAQKNQNKIESSLEPSMTWFEPTTNEFSGKIISKEYARGQVVSSSTRSNKQRVVCKQGDNVKDSGEETNDNVKIVALKQQYL